MWCSVFIPSWGRMKTSRWGNRACLCLFLTSGIPDGLFMQVYVWLCTCAQPRVGLNHGWSMQGVLTNLNLGLGDSNSKTKWILSCPWGPPVLVNCRLGHTHEPSQNRGCLGRWVWIFTHLAPPFSHFSDLSYPAGPGGKTKSVFSPSTASVKWFEFGGRKNEVEQGSICHGLFCFAGYSESLGHDWRMKSGISRWRGTWGMRTLISSALNTNGCSFLGKCYLLSVS